MAAEGEKIARRLGAVIKLRDGAYEKYKSMHAAVWPQVCSLCRREGARSFHV